MMKRYIGTRKASDAGFTVASYNIGFFYYSGLAGLEQDLIMAKKYWLLSASQWLNSEGLHDATAEGLLDEINEYNPNPTKEMIELKRFLYNVIKIKPKLNEKIINYNYCFYKLSNLD